MADSTTLAVFELGGIKEEKRDIIDFNFDFSQPIDKDNQPCGIPRPGKINVKILSNKTEGNVQLLSWMLNCQKKDGKIIINDIDGNTINTIEFKDAYCVNYKLSWAEMWFEKGSCNLTNAVTDKTTNITTGTPSMVEEISIAWKNLSWNGVSYENNWK